MSEQFYSDARLYDRLFPGGEQAVDFYRAEADRQGGCVLELGCGTGHKLIPIASDGHPCTGLELSSDMLTEAQRKADERARARLAGYLARSGQPAAAEAMFREVVESRLDASNLPPSFARVLRPYIDLLLAKDGGPAVTADICQASQLMMRPGLAQTQAVLARELSGGSDQAARLFRQAVGLTRLVERNRVALNRLQGLARPLPE